MADGVNITLSPFIRPKLGKLHEATCVFCQRAPTHHEMKEASKCLEKVLVQNILFGLSPSITDAIHSMSRWQLARTALPYVLHCTASLLINRKESNMQGLGVVESKLLYTLHWLLLDAADECCQMDEARASGCQSSGDCVDSPFAGVFSIMSLQVFFYLFAPIMHSLKRSDFNNVRLEAGLSVWSPLWQCRLPAVACFCTLARAAPSHATTAAAATTAPAAGALKVTGPLATSATRSHSVYGNVFIGLDNSGAAPSSPSSATMTAVGDEVIGKHSSDDSRAKESAAAAGAVVAAAQDAGDGGGLLCRQTITEETITAPADDEHVMIIRLDSSEADETMQPPNVYRVTSDLLSIKRTRAASKSSATKTDSNDEHSESAYTAVRRDSSISLSAASPHLATLADVAVLRCLFVSHWLEEGVFWSLQYLFNRLQDILGSSVEPEGEELVRKRSNSLPVPKIEVSLFPSAESPQKREESIVEDPAQSTTQSTTDPAYIHDSPFLSRPHRDLHKRSSSIRSVKSIKGKMRMPDLRAFVETKLWSRSQTMLEKLTHEGRRASVHILDTNSGGGEAAATASSTAGGSFRCRSVLNKRPSAHDVRVTAGDGSTMQLRDDGQFQQGLVKGKSMPSLRYMGQCHLLSTVAADSGSVAPPGGETATHPTTPLITITKYTPTPSPSLSTTDSHAICAAAGPTTGPQSRLNKSISESNVLFAPEETPEAPAAVGFVDEKGALQLSMVLKALHGIVMRPYSVFSLRVCERVVALLDVILTMHLLPAGGGVTQSSAGTSPSGGIKQCDGEAAPAAANTASGDGKRHLNVCSHGLGVHHTCIDIVVRVFRRIGCVRGCCQGFQGGGAESLRSQMLLILTRLMKSDESSFKTYLLNLVDVGASVSGAGDQAGGAGVADIIEFLHALTCWCSDTSHSPSTLNQKRSSNKGSDTHYTYANSFGGNKSTGSMHGVDGCVVGVLLTPLVSRLTLMARELKHPENMTLYQDVRQFLCYARDHHGGVFRRALLYGFLESADAGSRRNTITATKLVRRVHSAVECESHESPTSFFAADDTHPVERTSRKSIFKRKTMASLSSNVKLNSSVQNMLDTVDDANQSSQNTVGGYKTRFRQNESSAGNRRGRSLRIAAAILKKDDRGYRVSEQESLTSPFHSTCSSTLEGGASLTRVSLYRRLNAGSKTTVGRSFVRARRRVEDHLHRIGLKKSKTRDRELEDVPDHSRHNSWEFIGGPQQLEYMVVKQCRLVDTAAVRHGMKLMSLIMESVSPGTVPDVPLIAAAVTLEGVPVVARACFYLECAHFVHRCGKGHWPSWMKLGAAATVRGSGVTTHNNKATLTVAPACGGGVLRHSHLLQRGAGKLFYQWAESLGSRLESLLQENQRQNEEHSVDEQRRRQLRLDDDEEDFLDEACVNSSGRECPAVLLFACCVLLHEITVFVRDTQPLLPRYSRGSSSTAGRERGSSGAGAGGVLGVPCGGRRWSTSLSIVGNIQSMHLTGVGGVAAPAVSSTTDHATTVGGAHGERKISFVLREPGVYGSVGVESESTPFGGSHGALLAGTDDSSPASAAAASVRAGRIAAGARAHLLKRSVASGAASAGSSGATAGVAFFNSSVRRRSIKLRRGTATAGSKEREMDVGDSAVHRAGSVRSQRKVSAVSECISIHSGGGGGQLSFDESPSGGAGVGADDLLLLLPDTPNSEPELDGESTNAPAAAAAVGVTTQLPWLGVTARLLQQLNYDCNHQHSCVPSCHRRAQRASARLFRAIKQVYVGCSQVATTYSTHSKNSSRQSSNKERVRVRRADVVSADNAASRKESLGRKERMDRGGDDTLSRFRLNTGSLQFSKETINSTDLERCAGGESAAGGGGTAGGAAGHAARKPPPEEPPIVKYLTSQVSSLFHTPLKLLTKCSCVLSEDLCERVLPVTWNLLLEDDHVVSSAAAALFIIFSVKVPAHVKDLLSKNLHHENPSVRVDSLLKFQVLWRCRHQCWPRMEEAAQLSFKVPPPGIEFTLPSPKIGIESLPVVDPSWMAQMKSRVEDVTLKEELHSIVSAGKTRRKQQAELVQVALQKQHEKRRADRENCRVSAAPLACLASHEPSFCHVQNADEHDDSGTACGVRSSILQDVRLSCDMTADSGSRFCHQFSRLAALDEEASDIPRGPSAQIAPAMFPGVLCSVVVDVIDMLDDTAITGDSVSVHQTARKVIWRCLVEDSALFVRHIFERLTREHQHEAMARYIRRLVHSFTPLPPQTSFWLYNYLIGFVMFQIRCNTEFATHYIANALSLIWTIVPSVQGILFKDLKQIFRKEQCDATMLITANVPSAKRVIVHGPQGPDSGGIPSQFPIQEDTQFCQVLHEAREFFDISDDQHCFYHLIDFKTGVIHNPACYVRDFYFFKRSQYPQLSLMYIAPEDAYNAMQSHMLNLKLQELGKILKSLSILMRGDQIAQRVFFLHEELTKLPAFPRKALEAEFHLYKGGHLGKELHCLDRMHKLVWVRLMARMFDGMSGSFAYTGDVHLFVNVVNGCLMLHCEDGAMLRLVMATFISAAHQFRNVFSSNGYMLIMPTMLQVYNSHQSNSLLCRTIEFICKQFYVLHRKPFVLQMLGSVATMLDMNPHSTYGDANKIQPRSLFRLLISLETPSPDPLNTVELVSVEKPLRALDFCYHEETDDVTIMHVINLCVTVVAYAADSRRAHHMLHVLDAVIPLYLTHVQRTSRVHTTAGPKAEMKCEKQVIHQLALSVKTLLHNCEPLAKNYTGPTRGSADFKASSVKTFTRNATAAKHHHHSQQQPQPAEQRNVAIDIDDESPSRVCASDRRANFHDRDLEDSEMMRDTFRRPRDTLLSIVANFLTRSSARLRELNKKPAAGGDVKQTELLDVKCHSRLADVALCLLKVAPYDPDTMSSSGLLLYMNHILPYPDWSLEQLKPTLLLIMRRLEKVFSKILKKLSIRRHTDWSAASNLLKGVYTTLCKYPYIAHLPPLKSLIQVCQMLVVGESVSSNSAAAGAAGGGADVSTVSEVPPGVRHQPPQQFVSTVVRLIAMQMLAQGDAHSLEQVCGGSSLFVTQEKTEVMLMNLLLPLCLRVGCGRSDVPQMRRADISFALSAMLHALQTPSARRPVGSTLLGVSSARSDTSAPPHGAGCSSLHPTAGSARSYSNVSARPAVYSIAFLGLKILMVCFEQHLTLEWPRIARTITELGSYGLGGLALWDFLDFVVTYPSPLFILLLPVIRQHLDGPTYEFADEERFKQLMRQKLAGNLFEMPSIKCKGSILMELAHEMKLVKEEMINSKCGVFDHRKSVVADLHSCTRTRLFTSSFAETAKSVKLADSSQQSMDRQTSVRSDRPQQQQPPPPPTRRTGRVHSMKSRGAVERFLRRTSYAGTEEYSSGVAEARPACSEPRLYRKSLFFVRKRGSRFSKVAAESTSGGTSEEVSGVGGSLSHDDLSRPAYRQQQQRQNKQRLQRQKAQSRRTFRYRRTRRDHSLENASADQQPEVATEKLHNEEAQLSPTSVLAATDSAAGSDARQHVSSPQLPPTVSDGRRTSEAHLQPAAFAIPETIEEGSPSVSLLASASLPAPPPPPPTSALAFGGGAWWRPDSDVSPTSSSAAYRESLWLKDAALCQLANSQQQQHAEHGPPLSPQSSTPAIGGGGGGSSEASAGGATGGEVSSLPGDASSTGGGSLASDGHDTTETTALLLPPPPPPPPPPLRSVSPDTADDGGGVPARSQTNSSSDQNTLI